MFVNFEFEGYKGNLLPIANLQAWLFIYFLDLKPN